MDLLLYHLQKLGLTEKQARVYVSLIELGKGTAYEIAKRSHVKRPTVYIVLDELRLRGLVHKIPHPKKQLFIAKEPDELFALEEERVRNARKILPELLAKASSTAHKRVHTYFFEGQRGMKQALEYGRDSLRGKELLAYYAQAEKGPRSIPEFYYENARTLASQKTNVRSFHAAHESLKEFRDIEKNAGWVSLPVPLSELSSDVTVEIAPDFVRILLHKDSQAFIVENTRFAHMMKQVFEMLWSTKIP